METSNITSVVESTTEMVSSAAETAATWMETLQELVVQYGLQVLGALAILIIGMWFAKQLKKVLCKVMEKGKVDPTLISFVASLAYVFMQVFVVVAALEKLNVKTTSFVAILGAAGLAIGLALQGSLSNFASGVLMIIFKPFKVNDLIEAGGVLGTVREIGIFTTHVDTLDNKKTIVPNSKLMSDNITNYSANKTRRVDITAGISYGDDIDKARASIQAVLKEVPGILESPAPDIFVSEMADSSVNFKVRPWCHPNDYWGVYFGMIEGIKKKFDAEDITIPFPQRDVHMYEHKED
ncbi:mechanosensitive ion channel family protein [Pontiella sulfatireligans]|uniref:Small-conductance mechanosensitive channel n=1 Tax=Pontiella sulfatireligans TaxID=2750658 RepID=A0A6C2UIN9_9BACT|nr:mechanosensitive ion channel domain-containing protein [Pontiella sulfatireligans]VGO20070.1 Small-conductance mechanosensitive channel [Pontiella sulfatireligans]